MKKKKIENSVFYSISTCLKHLVCPCFISSPSSSRNIICISVYFDLINSFCELILSSEEVKLELSSLTCPVTIQSASLIKTTLKHSQVLAVHVVFKLDLMQWRTAATVCPIDRKFMGKASCPLQEVQFQRWQTSVGHNKLSHRDKYETPWLQGHRPDPS